MWEAECKHQRLHSALRCDVRQIRHFFLMLFLAGKHVFFVLLCFFRKSLRLNKLTQTSVTFVRWIIWCFSFDSCVLVLKSWHFVAPFCCKCFRRLSARPAVICFNSALLLFHIPDLRTYLLQWIERRMCFSFFFFSFCFHFSLIKSWCWISFGAEIRRSFPTYQKNVPFITNTISVFVSRMQRARNL